MSVLPVLLCAAIVLSGCALRSSGSGGGGGSSAASGVTGTVTIGPTCPVLQAKSPCPDKPFATQVSVTDAAGKVVVTTKSGADGSFKVELAPGAYTVSAVGSMSGAPSPGVRVSVTRGQWATVHLTVDSGIR
jgi:hypothetical protein